MLTLLQCYISNRTDTDETLGLVSVSADFRVSVSDSVSV